MYLQRRKEVLLAKKLTVPSICTLPYRPSNQKGAPWQHAWSAVVNPQFTRVGVGAAQDFPCALSWAQQLAKPTDEVWTVQHSDKGEAQMFWWSTIRAVMGSWVSTQAGSEASVPPVLFWHWNGTGPTTFVESMLAPLCPLGNKNYELGLVGDP